jgi:hypothetical protein
MSKPLSPDAIAKLNVVLLRCATRAERNNRGRRPKYVKWSRRELDLLFKLYPITSNEQLEREFPRHSASSIRSMAYNVGAKRRRDWKKIAAQHTTTIPSLIGGAG